MEKLTCKKCDHSWVRRIDGLPLCCPSCHSRLWNLGDYTKCSICQRNFLNLQVHHKDRNRKNNKKENLVALCKDCHVAVHHGITGNINLSKNTNKTGHHGRQRTYQENSPEGKKIKELQKFWWDAVKNKKEI